MADTPKPMKAIIFAGGIGTRMWPLSRSSTPKQFEAIVGDKSTLQMAVDRIRPEFDWENIYVSTGERYRDIILHQAPEIPAQNVIGEPEMRDVGPAVGYLMSILALEDPDVPVAILWSDHLVDNVDKFKQALIAGSEYLHKHPNNFVFLGQRPRFANQNLGWIEFGETIDNLNGTQLKSFTSWHYRPDLATAKKYFRDGKHAWNPGYFIVTPRFCLSKFEQHAPDMYAILMELQSSYGKPEHPEKLRELYSQMEKISFDDAVIAHVPSNEAVVLPVDLGWSDIGAWEALKEALQTHPAENVVKGNVHTHLATNNLVYSTTNQLVTAIDVEGLVVVVTDDAVLVTRQQSIPEIKKMLATFKDTPLEKYT
jgi:mannose-1-phosphate guanylyltransferase